MTYDPSNGVSLTELIYLVRNRMEDHVQEGYATAEGDAAQYRFSLPNAHLVPDTLAVTVDGTTITAYTADEVTGWVTFTSPPGAPTTEGTPNITFSYQYTMHTDEQITEAINAAIDDCFGDLVVQGENDELVTDGTTELLCETSAGDDLHPDDIVERVEYWADPHWVTLRDWRVRNHSGKKYLHFRRLPKAGLPLRISYIVRPGQLETGTQTLEGTAGLPTRAKEAIILFACAKLVSAQLSARTHSNMFYNVEGVNANKVFDLRMRVQDLQAEGELALRKARPRRVVGSF